jgi:hypothetical protein
VVGAEIAKKIVDADFFQPFEQVIGRGKLADIGLAAN